MQELWCWRCRMVVPMLDEEEWPDVDALLTQGMREVMAYRREYGVSLEEARKDVYQPALDAYERITGFHETNHLALYHHRASMYGPPCWHCGKPLRTPEATLCAACGMPRSTS